MKKGTVIKVHVENTIPPKVKYIIVLAADKDKRSYACIFINTDINVNVLSTAELKALQCLLKKENNPFLDYDSWANCSHIFLKDCSELDAVITNQPEKNVGEIHADDLKAILKTVKEADTTKPNFLKVFDF